MSQPPLQHLARLSIDFSDHATAQLASRANISCQAASLVIAKALSMSRGRIAPRSPSKVGPGRSPNDFEVWVPIDIGERPTTAVCLFEVRIPGRLLVVTVRDASAATQAERDDGLKHRPFAHLLKRRIEGGK